VRGMRGKMDSRPWSFVALAATGLATACGLVGPGPMSLDAAARDAGVTQSVVRIDDEMAGAVQLRGGTELRLLLFIRQGDGWIQSGSAGPGQLIGDVRLGLVGGGQEDTHRTILFGAGPPGVASVSRSGGPFVFGISDLAAGTWLLAAPVEHSATMRWTVWDGNGEPILSGRGLVIEEP
jgi:hypothetical protein